MKIHQLLATALLFTTAAFAGPGHSHGAREAGPNGGRVLTNVHPHAEFFVTPERKVRITFLDDAGKPVPPAGQSVTVTTGERSAPTRLTFTSDAGTSLLSEQTLPAGESWPAVVQIKETPDGKTIVEKFTLNLATCPGCSHPEYACTCDHGH